MKLLIDINLDDALAKQLMHRLVRACEDFTLHTWQDVNLHIQTSDISENMCVSLWLENTVQERVSTVDIDDEDGVNTDRAPITTMFYSGG